MAFRVESSRLGITARWNQILIGGGGMAGGRDDEDL